MIPRPDLLDERSPDGIEVVQLTDEPDVPSCHVYMEAHVFTPDSRRIVLHRGADPHGHSNRNPEHRYLLCDLEDTCRLTPLTEEQGATGMAVSPDGRWLYYFVDETQPGEGQLALKRVGLDGTGRETLMVVDGPLSGTGLRPSRAYPHATVRTDGRRLAEPVFLGDGRTAHQPPFGLMVFDLAKATVELVLHGPSWCNIHAQYSRSTDVAHAHDILVQENHGNVTDASGHRQRYTGDLGADIHVIRDDGTHLRDLPWGRDGNEHCQGHQCWRGCTTWAITSTARRDPPQWELIEGRAVEHQGHIGSRSQGAIRNDLSCWFPTPGFSHFGVTADGRRMITDCEPFAEGGRIFLASLGKPGEEPIQEFAYLLSPRAKDTKTTHIHPFPSPDGTMAFFNSDESGVLQAYMVTGIDRVSP